jgi:hypothetical protein
MASCFDLHAHMQWQAVMPFLDKAKNTLYTSRVILLQFPANAPRTKIYRHLLQQTERHSKPYICYCVIPLTSLAFPQSLTFGSPCPPLSVRESSPQPSQPWEKKALTWQAPKNRHFSSAFRPHCHSCSHRDTCSYVKNMIAVLGTTLIRCGTMPPYMPRTPSSIQILPCPSSRGQS